MAEEFRSQVQEYINLDNQIKEATSALSTLKKRKTKLQLNINGYMTSNGVDELKLNDCKLKTYTSTTTAPVNQDWIFKRLTLLLNGNEGEAQKWCDFICDKEAREKKTKQSLRRTKLGKAKKKADK